ncbi:MAG TPA: hypothetical protein VFP14_14040, partial [Novosphingobium sp.]|nr:hypothetical protein [Novosphingobium sp.]
YTRAFSGGWPSPAPGRRLSSHDGVAVEVAALAPSGATVRTCNVYRCGPDGLIRDLSIFTRG